MIEYLAQAYQSFYEVLWVFIIYAFLGWCSEVAYAALDLGKFVNRGFLNGPVCPIYGCGIVIVVSVLTPIKGNLAILFFGSVILTTALELVVGWGLETIFHNQWWDYSMFPFNFKGYICLKFSLLWGLACTFVMDIVHPLIMGLIRFIPKKIGIILLILLFAAFIADCIITVAEIMKLNKKLRILTQIQDRLDHIAVEIGENIYEGVTDAIETSEKIKNNFEENRETNKGKSQGEKGKLLKEKEELKSKYRALLEEKRAVQNRLLKGFPDMKSRRHQVSLQKLKTAISHNAIDKK